MNDVILEVRDLRTRFKTGAVTTEVVRGVSFSVRRGRTLGIVGESGCGKSVTVHSVINLLPPQGTIAGGSIRYCPSTGGAVEITGLARYGREMRALRGSEIGMIFQDPMASLNPVYTVGDQIVENLRQHERMTRRAARARAAEMLKKLGIPDAAHRIDDYPHQFSGGMKQRVMIAIAMILGPQILIADEPTTALDVTIQAQIMDLMREIQVSGDKSIILITHNMGLMAEMAHDIAVMYMGRFMEYGTAEQIFESPRHPYTRALLKSVPVLGMEDMRRLYAIPGSTPSAQEVPEGCAFSTRCALAREECRRGLIEEHITEDGHMTRCILAKEGVPHD